VISKGDFFLTHEAWKWASMPPPPATGEFEVFFQKGKAFGEAEKKRADEEIAASKADYEKYKKSLSPDDLKKMLLEKFCLNLDTSDLEDLKRLLGEKAVLEIQNQIEFTCLEIAASEDDF